MSLTRLVNRARRGRPGPRLRLGSAKGRSRASFGLVLFLAGAPAACIEQKSGRLLDVFAAASLTDAFSDLEASFEEAHPGVDVRVSFAGSQVLRLQIEKGARADVFASANPTHLEALEQSGYVKPGQVFAKNELVLIVPPENPAGLERFEDLGSARRIVIGTDTVPIGLYTREVLDRAQAKLGRELVERVYAGVASEETNVRLVRAKVELGEADAAFVYRTDAAASTRVKTISIPPELNARAEYVVAVLAKTPRLELSNAFVAHVLSGEGRAALQKRGFVVE